MGRLRTIFLIGANLGDNERESNNDEDVLEGLQPHPNLKSLEIVNFGSEKFPSWLLMRENSSGDLLLFDHLLEIRLENCNKCKRIPSLGQLPCLKVLKINGMDNLKCIGAEFYSSYSAEGSSNSGVGSNVVFPALKRLVLERMPNLMEWKDPMEPTTTRRTVFPCLEELTLLDCKKLISAPCHFPSLQKLVISRIRSTVFENITSRLTTLTTLNITSVSELACLSDQLPQNNSGLTYLTIWGCDELVSISSHQNVWVFCTYLRSIRIIGCHKLSDLPIALHTLRSLEKFEVIGCPNLRSFPSLQGVGSLLRNLGISCVDEVLPTGLQSCTSLSELHIKYCPNLISIPDLGELHSLTGLEISDCSNLKSIPNLRQLHSLTELRIMRCQNLTHLPEELDCLTCLESLEIGGFCEELDAFPSLSSTSIQHLYASLEKLYLYGWDKLQSLPDDIQCFTALRTLWIAKFDRMEALPEWLGNLFSLQNLDIFCCENLMYMATIQRLTKLTILQISNCPKLKERCAKGTGAEWSNIAHIPLITIDGNDI
ncbi:putative disease resistance protein rga4 [Quercus suber]|uniref:Disease resistance protein rga4 n=1 Tax=Quercus suber TaxID=58331 RepID=A0AAW0LZ56_QUESU